ncbi:nuclease-related domain-containing protein [Bacillus thuringiensis]|uniref:nuclease-related domain-containing protein n=1 Tax=Bacillus thuringiensis TaxID=1428 RepID=UPI0011A53FAF|nr:nuclease-related domain-containing protein [Bacillus thuringiensis]
MEIFLFIGTFVLTFLFVTTILYLLFNRWNYYISSYKKVTGFNYQNIYQNKTILAEWKVFRRLEKSFPDSLLLANLQIPCQEGTATDIDVVLIHSSGVYIIECKTLKGKLYGSDKNKEWIQWITSQNKNSIVNPIPKNNHYLRFFSQYLSLTSDKLHSFIVFGKETLTVKVKMSSHTRTKVIQVDDIEKSLNKIMNESSPLLTSQEMKDIYSKLSLLTVSAKPK